MKYLSKDSLSYIIPQFFLRSRKTKHPKIKTDHKIFTSNHARWKIIVQIFLRFECPLNKYQDIKTQTGALTPSYCPSPYPILHVLHRDKGSLVITWTDFKFRFCFNVDTRANHLINLLDTNALNFTQYLMSKSRLKIPQHVSNALWRQRNKILHVLLF